MTKKIFLLSLFTFISISLLADPKSELEAIKAKAEEGNASAQYHLGMIYFEKDSLAERDEKKAVDWLTKAASQDHIMAQYALSICYANGVGVTKDLKKAIELIMKRASHGSPYAQYLLGTFYSKNNDDENAFKWIAKSAENGEADAQELLGHYYEKGIGVCEDKSKSSEWYEKAKVQKEQIAKGILKFKIKNVKRDASLRKTIQNKLDTIIFEQVDFQDVTIPTVVKYFHVTSISNDLNKEGINLILILDDALNNSATMEDNGIQPTEAVTSNEIPTVTLIVNKIPAGELLKLICKHANLNFRIDPYAVVIGRKIPEYNVNPDPLSQGKFASLMISQIDLEESKAQSVLALLTEKSKELDVNDKSGLNIIIDDNLDMPKLTMSLDEIPIGELIRYICLLLELKYDVKENTVILYKEKTPQP